MNSYQYRIAFRVFHPRISGEEICARIGLPVSRKWNVGEQRTTVGGEPLQGMNGRSYCLFYLDFPEISDIAAALQAAVGVLGLRTESLRDLAGTGGTLEFYVVWFAERNSGDVLSWRLLRMLADLSINLAIDIYPKRFEPADHVETQNSDL